MKTNNYKPFAFFLLISLFLSTALTAREIKDTPGVSPNIKIDLTEKTDTAALGIRAILREKKKNKSGYGSTASIITFDIKTLVMKWDHAGWQTKIVNDPSAERFIISIGNVTLAWKDEEVETRMFFDKYGFVYTPVKKKFGGTTYVKAPFIYFKKMMSSFSNFSGGLLPNLPDGSITYHGMDLNPYQYPVLEWAFVYKPHYFENSPNFDKTIINDNGLINCTRYTITTGKDKGSYIMFNAEGNLIEINSINSGNIIYNYGDYNVSLP